MTISSARRTTRQEPAAHYAFKCTAASSGNDYLADLRGSSRDYFIATTVDLLTTGVDVPVVRNIGFFRYVRSPISFYLPAVRKAGDLKALAAFGKPLDVLRETKERLFTV